MKSYFVLRNNKEYGPYTPKDLQGFKLNPDDLIWIEDESNSWSYVTEIEELTTSITHQKKQQLPLQQAVFPGLNNPSSDTKDNLQAAKDKDSEHSSENVHVYSSSRLRRRKKNPTSGGFFGFVVLVIGIVLCAFLVNRIMEGFDYNEFSPTAEAITIKQAVLPISITDHAAEVNNVRSQLSTSLLSAVSKTDSAQIQGLATKPIAKQPIKKAVFITDTMVKNAVVNKEEESLIQPELKEELPEKKEEVMPQPIDISSLQLSANDFKVGLFGGISNLELSVTNSSSHTIGKAVIEVEYLKPNGNVVKSQTVFVENIAAGNSKTLAVPSSNRGVKLRYRVVSVEAK